MKTNWDFTLFYKNDTDPQIEKDVKEIESACAGFAKKYNRAVQKKSGELKNEHKPASFLKTEKSLAETLTDYEKLYAKVGGSKPLVYWHYRAALESNNATVASYIQKITERLTKAGNLLTFFDVALSKTPRALQKKYLASKKLLPWRHMLTNAYASGRYTLTEAEEKILSLTSQPHGMWVDGVEKALNKRVVEVVLGGNLQRIPIHEAIPKLATLHERKDREALWAGIAKELSTLEDFCESELNAFYTHKKIIDGLRGYAHPYSATFMGHEVDEKTVLALVAAVQKRMSLPQRFFALKKKLMEQHGHLKKGEKMRLFDTNAPLPVPASRSDAGARASRSGSNLSFEEGYTTVREAYAAVDADFAQVYAEAFLRGQVDVFAKEGKGGGGFHSKTVGAPGVILLNYVPDRRSQFTLAHEMGHFLHSTYSERHQRPIYQHYSTAAAEVASTFGEQVLFNHLAPLVSGQEKTELLYESLLENITAVFRVIADYTCEDTLYRRIYSEGYLPMAEIQNIYVESRKQYVGESVDLLREDGLRVIYTSHFRLKYYWYSYAFGCLIARALWARVEKDPTYIEKVKHFLAAGGSDTPKNIFKQIGIDISRQSFWDEGLDALERDLAAFEQSIA